MNRRENGLSADAYTPLIDLVPDLADELLALLGAAGIAAYALPGDTSGPDVLDHVHVDVAHKREAERLLHPLLRDRLAAAPAAPGADARPEAPERDQRDDDAIFAEIVAGFDTPAEQSWPDEEHLDPGEDRTGRLPTARIVFSGTAPPETAEESEKSAKSEKDTDEDDEAEGDLKERKDPGEQEPDEEGHYEPPPPPPLPVPDPTTRLAWVCLVGGPAYILTTVVMRLQAPGWAAFLAVAAFIGGFVTLVLRMGDEPRDGDDGAVV
ncbi:hypothetical protein LO762_17480 [Actinocorallia sp. API 0066]|uniref:hypothetical protein n=1 Tax=Actinocorallia sp. API 0066 TaxID=2896846 RepID=UPI001E5E0085|nr:hypothetical protein [Actinocorallia sp. API 0066]MCD0450973.1 hypothetical protein [Actinocorallia sp. API 0066]